MKSKEKSKAKLALETIFDIVKTAKATGNIKAPTYLKKKRLSICKMCEYFSGCQCAICGCMMGMKSGLLAAKCPKGRWEEKLMEEAMFGGMSPDFSDEECCRKG